MSHPHQQPQQPAGPPALREPALAPEPTHAEARLSEQSAKVLPEAALIRTDQVLAEAPREPEAAFKVPVTATDSRLGLIRDITQPTDTAPGFVKISSWHVEIEATVDVEVPGDEIGKWQVGFIQTVTFQRELWIKATSGLYLCFALDLEPTRDAGESTEAPWYDLMSVRTVTSKSERLTVRMFDQPSLEARPAKGSRFEGFRGEDTYRTWLIAKKLGAPVSQIRFLRRWKWKIDWGGATWEGMGVEQVKERPGDSGAEAVLSGPVAPAGVEETELGPYDQPRFPPRSGCPAAAGQPALFTRWPGPAWRRRRPGR
jgi:hypothetical protein